MNNRRFIGNVFWGNCFLVSLILRISDKVDSIGVIGKFHFACMRKSQRILHFKSINRNLPWWKKLWFQGRLELISTLGKKKFRKIY